MMPILTKYFSAGKKQMLETTYNAWRHFVATIRQEAEMYAVLKKRQDEAARLNKKVKQAGKIHATVEEEVAAKQQRVDQLEEELKYWQTTMQEFRRKANESARAVEESEAFVKNMRVQVAQFVEDIYPNDKDMAHDDEDDHHYAEFGKLQTRLQQIDSKLPPSLLPPSGPGGMDYGGGMTSPGVHSAQVMAASLASQYGAQTSPMLPGQQTLTGPGGHASLPPQGVAHATLPPEASFPSLSQEELAAIHRGRPMPSQGTHDFRSVIGGLHGGSVSAPAPGSLAARPPETGGFYAGGAYPSGASAAPPGHPARPPGTEARPHGAHPSGGAHHSGAHPIGAHNHQAEAQAKFMHDMQEVDSIGRQAMQKHHDIEATHAHANLFGDMTELASAVRGGVMA